MRRRFKKPSTFEEKNVILTDLLEYPYITNKNLDEDIIYRELKEHGYNNRVIQVNDTVTREISTNVNGFFVGADIGIREGNKNYNLKVSELPLQGFSSQYAVGWIHSGSPMNTAEEKVLELLQEQTQCYNEAPLCAYI